MFRDKATKTVALGGKSVALIKLILYYITIYTVSQKTRQLWQVEFSSSID